ncbi:hypothetical protein HX773_24940 [Pantoea sp. B9002]|uniref:hypothetical protein n=1 Tax=Pantoea sp. B9002 TaxID=2726979 RepID=UPI0015A1B139|nr:hypothetical protein [Pantoea sp. B9002]NWA64147.1 hypothetical protein [Pantoea sp. B9002]
MPQETITISNNIKINDGRISHAISRISNVSPGTKIIIRFDHNSGGAVQAAVDLIEAIELSRPAVNIVLVFKGFAVSAAAFILGYFGFYNVVTPNVIVQMDGPVCVVYHKPRVSIGDYDHFASGLYPDRKYPKAVEFVRDMNPTFDAVFLSIITACYAKKIRVAPHMESVYNMNGDVSVMFKDGNI